jgi:hypothetical protein
MQSDNVVITDQWPMPEFIASIEKRSQWCSSLVCNWISWEVVIDRTLRLTVKEGECPDMEGCIKVAKSLMKDVHKIYVRDEVEPQRTINMYYYSRGKWRVYV